MHHFSTSLPSTTSCQCHFLPPLWAAPSTLSPSLTLSQPHPSFNAKLERIKEGSTTRGEPWRYIEPVVGCIEVAWGNGIIEKVQLGLWGILGLYFGHCAPKIQEVLRAKYRKY